MSVPGDRRSRARLRRRLEAVEARLAALETISVAYVEDLVAAEAHIDELKAQLDAHTEDKKGHH